MCSLKTSFFFNCLQIKVSETFIKPIISILSREFKFSYNCKKGVFSFVIKTDHTISKVMQYF